MTLRIALRDESGFMLFHFVVRSSLLSQCNFGSGCLLPCGQSRDRVRAESFQAVALLFDRSGPFVLLRACERFFQFRRVARILCDGQERLVGDLLLVLVLGFICYRYFVVVVRMLVDEVIVDSARTFCVIGTWNPGRGYGLDRVFIYGFKFSTDGRYLFNVFRQGYPFPSGHFFGRMG